VRGVTVSKGTRHTGWADEDSIPVHAEIEGCRDTEENESVDLRSMTPVLIYSCSCPDFFSFFYFSRARFIVALSSL